MLTSRDYINQEPTKLQPRVKGATTTETNLCKKEYGHKPKNNTFAKGSKETKSELHVLSQELHIDYSTLRTKVKQMNIDYLHQDEVTELKQEAVYQRIDNALPPGHPLTWDLICPGIEFPDPYTRSGKN